MLDNPHPYRAHDHHNLYSPIAVYPPFPSPLGVGGHYSATTPTHYYRERPHFTTQRRTQSFAAPSPQHAPEENLLRRKTPSGTLPAAYEATPYESSSRPTKHILLPTPQNETPQTPLQNSQWQHKDPYAPQIGHAPIATYPQNILPAVDNVGNRLVWGQAMPPQMVQSPGLALPMQNMHLLSPGILQPPQYVPAPDMGHMNPHPEQYLLNYQQGHNVVAQVGGWQNVQFMNGGPFHPTPYQLSQGVYSPNARIGNDLGFRRMSSVGVTPWDPSLQHLQQQQQQQQQQHAQRIADSNPYFAGPNNVSTVPYSLLSPTTDIEQFSRDALISSVQNLQPNNRRDAIFSWAHRVYAALLESQQKHNNFTQQHAQHRIGRAHSVPHIKTTKYLKPINTGVGGNGGIDPFSPQTPLTPQTPQHRPGFGPQFRKQSFPTTPLQGYPAQHRQHANTIQLANAALMGSNGFDVPPVLVTPGQRASYQDEARRALGILKEVCQSMQWKWLDGMLIAGCLAYGLSDLQQALEWYSRILKVDPDHVEAMSNLASTLFCLDRLNEAEEFWIRAIKKRPNFFEAIEHLVSLLCGQQRMKDAVKWIDHVQKALRRQTPPPPASSAAPFSPESKSVKPTDSPTSSVATTDTTSSNDTIHFDYYQEDEEAQRLKLPRRIMTERPTFEPYCIPATDNARMLNLLHAKANMLYNLGETAEAAAAFENAVLLAVGGDQNGLSGLVQRIINTVSTLTEGVSFSGPMASGPVLLTPQMALRTAVLVFGPDGELPGLQHVTSQKVKQTAKSTTSNALLSLAKIFQDGMFTGAPGGKAPSGVRDILALYYLSLALHPSPSTANNVGILLANVQQVSPDPSRAKQTILNLPNVVPGSGVELALQYYYFGLGLDHKHAHLYTNLGSLLKDLDQLGPAIKMYEKAVECDGKFDIALANLANAVKDQGKVEDAIEYYKRAVVANPEFAEAVCGLANALNSVCAWNGRGGVVRKDRPEIDRWHVDDTSQLVDSMGVQETKQTGWMLRVVKIVEKQLADGGKWGANVISNELLQKLVSDLERAAGPWTEKERNAATRAISSWRGKPYEGANVMRLVERITRALSWRWYQDKYITKQERPAVEYARPQFPNNVSTPTAPTVLPFHTFTCPLDARQVRMISQRNGLRISCSTLRSPWLPSTVYPPPSPPSPHLNVGYVSSDFNNHPLAHLMQSVFGFHDPSKVKAHCYATTPSDNSSHRLQIEREAPAFYDASSWSPAQLIHQIVKDNIHILINLNGFTRGARNEIFAARPAPIQMSFMGFAGTLGAEWCDYILADTTAIPVDTVRPWNRDVKITDSTVIQETPENQQSDWVYGENIVFTKHSFFCNDHRQSAPDADTSSNKVTWPDEVSRRWAMRKELFPDISDSTVILGNFNQLYKLEPTTFRSWIRILSRCPNTILWLLRFPELGEKHLLEMATIWGGPEVAARVRFTNVAQKNQHIARAKICDLFLDTPECNAHTTAADVLWSGTPLLTLPRHKYKMCSRVAASLIRAAVPQTPEGKAMADGLIKEDEESYERRAIELCNGLAYTPGGEGKADGELMRIRKVLFEGRWTNELFDTRRWVRDLERAYEIAWERWEGGREGDIFLCEEERGRYQPNGVDGKGGV